MWERRGVKAHGKESCALNNREEGAQEGEQGRIEAHVWEEMISSSHIHEPMR